MTKHSPQKSKQHRVKTGDMSKFWLSGAFLAHLFCTITVVHSSHFRGAVIMVRPKDGGEETEVHS